MTRNVMSTALIVFMAMAITLVAIVLPVSAQTVSADLLTVIHDPVVQFSSQGEIQEFRARVRNDGCQVVDVYVFLIFSTRQV